MPRFFNGAPYSFIDFQFWFVGGFSVHNRRSDWKLQGREIIDENNIYKKRTLKTCYKKMSVIIIFFQRLADLLIRQ